MILSTASTAPRDLILGIDPGLKGGIVFLNSNTSKLEAVYDVPTCEVKDKKIMNIYALHNLIEMWATRTRFAVIEKVGAAPHQGVSSVFKFGFTAGATQAAVICNGIAVVNVPPAAWKMGLGMDGPSKDESRELAIKEFPAHANYFKRKMDDGRAEAALIALYGMRSAATASTTEGTKNV